MYQLRVSEIKSVFIHEMKCSVRIDTPLVIKIRKSLKTKLQTFFEIHSCRGPKHLLRK